MNFLRCTFINMHPSPHPPVGVEISGVRSISQKKKGRRRAHERERKGRGGESDCGGGGGGGKKDEKEEENEEEEWLTGRPQQTRSKPNLPVLPLATTTTYRTITCNQSISGLRTVSPSFSLSFSLFLSCRTVRCTVCVYVRQNGGIPRVLCTFLTDVILSHAQRKKLFSPREPTEP